MHKAPYIAATRYVLSEQPRAVALDSQHDIFRLLDFGS